ncbi:MAG: hypothetical protein B7Z80_20235 [Rhodospirillales bacterium 20-64-7]|nr:MAG: hypothetical protein B7Z80_20235 [Rhodospirillales bacterium 20-64-7]
MMRCQEKCLALGGSRNARLPRQNLRPIADARRAAATLHGAAAITRQVCVRGTEPTEPVAV